MTSKKHYGKQTGRPVTHELPTPAGGVRLETFVPWTLVRRGLKKRIITPLDAPQEFLSEANRERAARAAAQDSALMRALGLAHHWQRLLDEERAASVADIAKAEGMDVTQVRRVMRLTLLAPEVIERLVCTPHIVLEQVMRRPWPGIWWEQERIIACLTSPTQAVFDHSDYSSCRTSSSRVVNGIVASEQLLLSGS